MANRTSAVAREIELEFDVEIDVELPDDVGRPLEFGPALEAPYPGSPLSAGDRRRLRRAALAGAVASAAAVAMAVGIMAVGSARVQARSPEAERSAPPRSDRDPGPDAVAESAVPRASDVLAAEPPAGPRFACEIRTRTWLEPGDIAVGLGTAPDIGAEAVRLGEAAAARPDLLWPGVYLAGVLAGEGWTDGAVEVLDRVLAAHPGEEAPLWMKAELLAPPPARTRPVFVPTSAPPPRKPGLLPRKSSAQ